MFKMLPDSSNMLTGGGGGPEPSVVGAKKQELKRHIVSVSNPY